MTHYKYTWRTPSKSAIFLAGKYYCLLIGLIRVFYWKFYCNAMFVTIYIMCLQKHGLIFSISKIKPETRNLKPQTRIQNHKQEPVFLTVIVGSLRRDGLGNFNTSFIMECFMSWYIVCVMVEHFCGQFSPAVDIFCLFYRTLCSTFIMVPKIKLIISAKLIHCLEYIAANSGASNWHVHQMTCISFCFSLGLSSASFLSWEKLCHHIWWTNMFEVPKKCH